MPPEARSLRLSFPDSPDAGGGLPCRTGQCDVGVAGSDPDVHDAKLSVVTLCCGAVRSSTQDSLLAGQARLVRSRDAVYGLLVPVPVAICGRRFCRRYSTGGAAKETFRSFFNAL